MQTLPKFAEFARHGLGKLGMVCPKHRTVMVPASTRYGLRFSCPSPGCDVVGWDSPTSTPADAETRAARNKAHDAFDPLWRGRGARVRSKLYRKLSEFLCIPLKQTHIGMFDKEICEKVIEFARGHHAIRGQKQRS